MAALMATMRKIAVSIIMVIMMDAGEGGCQRKNVRERMSEKGCQRKQDRERTIDRMMEGGLIKCGTWLWAFQLAFKGDTCPVCGIGLAAPVCRTRVCI